MYRRQLTETEPDLLQMFTWAKGAGREETCVQVPAGQNVQLAGGIMHLLRFVQSPYQAPVQKCLIRGAAVHVEHIG
jgi:hypothetical protein